MQIFKTIVLVAYTRLITAAPTLVKRGVAIDQILNYALTLEHLEDVFYREGLAAFSDADFQQAGFDSAIRDNMVIIGGDETQHVEYLTAALSSLNVTPVSECTYRFNVTNVWSFITTASILEGVGVSAYLGAAADITYDQVLTASAAILSTEARHSAYLRAALGQTPSAKPFDDPLDFSQVYSLAAQFIESCNSTIQGLNITVFPALVVAAPEQQQCQNQTYASGDLVQFALPSLSSNVSSAYAAFVSISGPIFQNISFNSSSSYIDTTIPDGVNGQTYIVLTADDSGVSDANTLAGPAIIEITNY